MWISFVVLSLNLNNHQNMKLMDAVFQKEKGLLAEVFPWHSLDAGVLPLTFLNKFFIFYFIDQIENLCFFGVVQAAYNIGGQIVSANAVEQSIFSFRTPRIGRVLTLPQQAYTHRTFAFVTFLGWILESS